MHNLQICPRVRPYDCYAANAGFTLAEKTSLAESRLTTYAVRPNRMR